MSETVHEKTPLEIEWDGLKLSDLIKRMHTLRQALDEKEKEKNNLQKMYDFMSINYVPKRMENDGIESLKVDGVGRVNIRADIWIQTQNPQALQGWLIEHDFGDLVVPGVNGSTFKAFLKEQMRKISEIPGEEIVKITPYSRAVITKV